MEKSRKSFSLEQAKDILAATLIVQKAKFAIDEMAETENKYFGKDNVPAYSFAAQMDIVNNSQKFFDEKGIAIDFSEYVSPEIITKLDIYTDNKKKESLSRDEVRDFVDGYHEYNIAILANKNIDKIDGVLDKEKFNACFASLMWVPVDEKTVKGKRSKPMRDLRSWVYAEQAVARDKRSKVIKNMDAMKDVYMKKTMAPVISSSANEMIEIGLLSDKETAENLFKGIVVYSQRMNKQDVGEVVSAIIKDKEDRNDASIFAKNVSVKVLEHPYFKHEAQSVIDKRYKAEETFLEEKSPLLKKSRDAMNNYSEIIKTSFEYFKRFDKYEEANKNVMIIKSRGNTGR